MTEKQWMARIVRSRVSKTCDEKSPADDPFFLMTALREFWNSTNNTFIEQPTYIVLQLESIAGVPGFTAAMLRHLHSLRLMRYAPLFAQSRSLGPTDPPCLQPRRWLDPHLARRGRERADALADVHEGAFGRPKVGRSFADGFPRPRSVNLAASSASWYSAHKVCSRTRSSSRIWSPRKCAIALSATWCVLLLPRDPI